MLSLAKRRQFLERADFVHRLNSIGEHARAHHVATNLRNEEERIQNQTRPVEEMAGHAAPANSAAARASARDHDAGFARELAERLVYPGMTPNYVSAPQTPRRRVPLLPPPIAMPPPRAPRPKAKAKAHARSEEARLRDIERKRALRAADTEYRRRDNERRRQAHAKKK